MKGEKKMQKKKEEKKNITTPSHNEPLRGASMRILQQHKKGASHKTQQHPFNANPEKSALKKTSPKNIFISHTSSFPYI